jgi:hypothetical protein
MAETHTDAQAGLGNTAPFVDDSDDTRTISSLSSSESSIDNMTTATAQDLHPLTGLSDPWVRSHMPNAYADPSKHHHRMFGHIYVMVYAYRV